MQINLKKYFVSYQFSDIDSPGSIGFGCTELKIDEKIKGFSELQDMQNFIQQRIKEESGRDVNVVILYWRPFEE